MFSDAKNQLSTSATLALALILSLIVVIAPAGSERASAYAEDGACGIRGLGATGLGSSASPYGISTAAQLWEVTDCPGGNFELLADINVAGVTDVTTQSPIGTGKNSPYDRLTGILDGKGYSISFSMSVNGSAGLFKSISGAEIRNLTLSGTVSSNPSSALFTGGLAISASGQSTISNVTIALDLKAKTHVGGFVGDVGSSATLTIGNSSFAGSIEAQGATFSNGASVSRFVGGFVGQANSSTLIIFDSVSLGLISSSKVVDAGLFNRVGGFVGHSVLSTLSLRGLTRSALILSGGGGNQGTGGIVGTLGRGSASISRAVNLGSVRGDLGVGGLVGSLAGTFTGTSESRLDLSQSLNSGSIDAGEQVGGLIGNIGRYSTVTISIGVNNGLVTATAGNAGGLVGISDEPVSILNSENSATISVTANATGGRAGGILGVRGQNLAVASLRISSTTNSGTVIASQYAGGIVGAAFEPFSLSNVANLGKVSVSRTATNNDESGAGGLVGFADKQFTIENSLNSAQVISNTRSTGGLVGLSKLNVTIARSSNGGSVSGLERAGGFLGQALGSSSTVRIEDSTNSGDVKISGSSVGGFLGAAQIGAVVFAGLLNSGTVLTTNSGSSGGIYGFAMANTFSLSNLANVATVSANGGGAGGVGGQSTVVTGLSASDLRNSGHVSGILRVGGLFGYLPFAAANAKATISRAINSGAVSTATSSVNDGSGGIVGEAWGSVTPNQIQMSFFRVGNRGVISGNADVGGIIGLALTSPTSIQESFNEGSVTGFGQNVGGLAGRVTLAFSASNSYSVGSKRGFSRTAGLVGIAAIGASFDRAFVAASISATTNNGVTDGLDGGSVAPTTNSAFTTTVSRYVTTSPLDDLKSAALFTGWDFQNVWAYGECVVLGELPVLRWAHPNQTFSTTSCFVVVPPVLIIPNPTVSPSVTSTASAPAPAVSPQPQGSSAYSGPLVSAIQMIVFRGESFELRGTKLDVVTSVSIPGLALDIVTASSTSLTLAMPSSASLGLQDLVMVSSFGRLIILNALDARQRPIVVSQFGNLLGFGWSERFQGASRVLSPFQVSRVKLALANFPAATSVVCWGYATAVKPSPSAIAQATQRATSLCQAVSKAQPNLKTFIRVRFGVAPSATMRTAMQFWELTATN